MVHVPVQDRDPLDAAAARVLGRQGGVVEEAVAVGRAARGVVAGRAHQRVRQRRVAVEHGVAGADRGAGGRRQRRPGAGRRQRRARPPAAGLAARAHVVDVVAVVQPGDLVDGRVPAVAPAQVAGVRAVVQGAVHVAHAVGVLRVRLGYREPAGIRGVEQAGSGVVRENVRVPVDVEGRRHARRCTGECVSRQLHSLVARRKCRCRSAVSGQEDDLRSTERSLLGTLAGVLSAVPDYLFAWLVEPDEEAVPLFESRRLSQTIGRSVPLGPLDLLRAVRRPDRERPPRGADPCHDRTAARRSSGDLLVIRDDGATHQVTLTGVCTPEPDGGVRVEGVIRDLGPPGAIREQLEAAARGGQPRVRRAPRDAGRARRTSTASSPTCRSPTT